MTSECKHEPGPIAAFEWTCKHCHKLIEAVHCKECDGFGGLQKLEMGHLWSLQGLRRREMEARMTQHEHAATDSHLTLRPSRLQDGRQQWPG